MVDRRTTKKKPSPLAALGNVFLAIVLAVSLMPSYSAYGDSAGRTDNQVEEQTDASKLSEKAQPKDYYYVDTIDGASWVLKVNTADGDMPQAATPDDLMSWFGAANVTFSADEATDKAARAALSELYDVADDSAVSVGSFGLPDGKAMPSDAKLTAWRLSAGQAAPSSGLKAWAWDGSALTPVELADDESLSAIYGGGQTATFSVGPGQTVVVADASKLSEKAQPKDYYYVDTIDGASWVLKVNTADGDMPQAATPDDLMSWFGAANVTFSADEATDKAARAALSELYDVADDSAVSVGSFGLPDGKAMPSDAKLTAWRLSAGQAAPHRA